MLFTSYTKNITWHIRKPDPVMARDTPDRKRSMGQGPWMSGIVAVGN